MMGYAEFQRLDGNPTATIDINRQYDQKTMNQKKTVVQSHEIGWNIRAFEPGKAVQYGILHIHWKPKDGAATNNQNISAHFKDSHASQQRSGISNKREIPIPADALLYNRLAILNSAWTNHKSADRNRPTNAVTGWTSLKGARITEAMVNQFRQFNDQAALADLARNPLYDLSKWDHEGWNSYMWWMAGA